MTENALIRDVSDTSFWVAHYRAKESERDDSLFKDPFAKKLVGDLGKQISDSTGRISRYTEWAVVSRTVIIDRFIEALLKEGVDAVINLGAGLDARPYRMDLPNELEWIEVDYPRIVDHKNRVLKADQPTCRLTRIAADLTQRAERKELFSTLAPKAKKALIITEGVIPYLTHDQVAELAQDLLEQPRFSYWITEYFDPKVYRYLKSAVRTAKMKNAPFQFYPNDWFGFFGKYGWAEKETRFSGEIAEEFRRKPPMPKFAELIFPLLPRKVREESMRMAGYVVFRRTTN